MVFMLEIPVKIRSKAFVRQAQSTDLPQNEKAAGEPAARTHTEQKGKWSMASEKQRHNPQYYWKSYR
jgi:hypothetical protein